MSLYSNVRGREAHSDQYGHNKLTCNEREQEDLASRRDSPSHYSVIVGSGHIFHFDNLKWKSIKKLLFDKWTTVKWSTRDKNTWTFADRVNVIPHGLLTGAMVLGNTVRTSITLGLIRTAIWEVVRIAHWPRNTPIACVILIKDLVWRKYTYQLYPRHLNTNRHSYGSPGQSGRHRDVDDHPLAYHRTMDQLDQERQCDPIANEAKSCARICRPSHTHVHLKLAKQKMLSVTNQVHDQHSASEADPCHFLPAHWTSSR